MNTAERKITEALDTAVRLKNDGAEPDDCLIKAASDHQLNPDMTERLCESFNIALTNSRIKKMEDKTASFPIANKEKVLKGVFDTHEPEDKQKTASSTATFFSVSHASIPVLDFTDGRGDRMQPTAKLASVQINQAHGACDVLRAGLQKLAQDRMAAELKVNDGFVDLCSYLTETGNLHKFAKLEQQALLEYGEGIRPLLDTLHKEARLDKLKVARFTDTSDRVEFFPPSDGWNKFENFVSGVNALDAAEARHAKEAALVDGQVREMESLIHQLNGNEVEQKTATHLLSDSGNFFAKKADDEEPRGGGSVDALGLLSGAFQSPFDRANGLVSSAHGGVAGALADSYQRAHSEAMKTKMRGPKDEHNMERDNLIRQQILSELVGNDEIVSRMPHQDVEHSYSSLLNLAPALTLDHNLVRGWLRNSSATQALDPFTAGQLIKTQQDVEKNKLLTSGQLKPT